MTPSSVMQRPKVPHVPRRRTALEREAYLQGWKAGWEAAMRFVSQEARPEADAYREALLDVVTEAAR